MFTRHRMTAALVLLAAVLMLLATQAPAQAATPDKGTPLLQGWIFTPGTITSPGKPTRHLTSKHAVAFVQSWYIATFYGSLTEQHPPKNLPVYTFKADDTVSGGHYTFTCFYVTNGKKAWVGIPPQTIGPGAVVPTEKWFIAPPRTTPAFLGRLDPVPQDTGTTTTTEATTTTVAPAPGHSSSSGAEWAIGIVGIVVILGVGAWIVTRKRTDDEVEQPVG